MIEHLLNTVRILSIARRIASDQTLILSNQTQILSTLSRLEAKMSTQTDAWTALSAIEQKLEADELLDEQKITALTAERDALKTQLANTPQDDTAQLQELTAKLRALDDRIVAEQAAAASAAPASGEVPPPTT